MRIVKVKGAIDEAVLVQELHVEFLAPLHLHLLQFLLLLLADVVELTSGLPLKLAILSASESTIRVSVRAAIITIR